MISRQPRTAGVVAVEFALVSALLILLLTGTLGLGVLTWVQAGLQTVAQQTARCLAIGGTACPSGAPYAVSLAQARLFSGVISAANVTITSAASCQGASGQYTQVAITNDDLSSDLLAPPLNGIQLTATACYPSHS
jgi:Flp pilus assembly protein TadG